MRTGENGADTKSNRIALTGVGAVAVLAIYLLVAYVQKLPPFASGNQPIIISDSSVDVQLNGPLNLVDSNHHRIKGGKVDHIAMVDGNGTPSILCNSKQSCDQTIAWYQLNGSGPSYRIVISEPNGSDTDLGSDVAWNTNFWTSSGPTSQPKLTLDGRLVDQFGSWCRNCVYTICFSNTGPCTKK
ncbi:MAG: hypothetical protein ABSF12_17660 [Bryobacteraceae bacterium]|jgi:hypothetical protein